MNYFLHFVTLYTFYGKISGHLYIGHLIYIYGHLVYKAPNI